MASIEDIEGVGAAYAEKLKAAGVATVEALLESGAGKGGRTALATASGISEKLILKWVNHADLRRVKGIGSEYSELLEVAGVDSVVELAQRVPANLAAKMAEVNEAKKLVRSLPAVSAVEGWVAAAKQLPKVVTH